MNRATALCGHPGCDPYRRRNSVLDETGDVVLYHACDGRRYVFRDNIARGLIFATTGRAGWSLATDSNPDHPICEGGYDTARSGYVARHLASGRVIATADTQYGLLAKAARFYLRTTAT